MLFNNVITVPHEFNGTVAVFGVIYLCQIFKLCPFSIEIRLLVDHSVTFGKLKCYSLPFPAEPIFSKVLALFCEKIGSKHEWDH